MNRTAAAVVAGLAIGFVVLLVALGAARRGEIGWDVAQVAVLVPVGLALVFGVLVRR